MPIRPVPVRSRLCKPGIPWIFRRFILLGTLAAALVPASVRAQGTPPPPFIIEAEDYNFGSGQTLPIASQMPYLGGAFKGKSNAVSKVDYTRNANNSSPVYRNDRNIPILASPDLDRGSWSVAENYRLVMLGGGATATAEWFNYTRTFPTGKFRAFAAISYGALGDSLAKGSLLRVNNGATNATQPTTSLGTFNGPGSGSWTQNTLVPLKDTKGNVVVFDLGGTQTLRLATESGDFDYLKLVQVFPPVIGQQPVELSVPERHPVTLTVSTVGEDPAFFQWQTNQVAAVNGTNILTRVTISGATTPSLTLNLPLSSGTLLVRCVVTNQAGTTLTTEVPLHVVPDVTGPVITAAQSISQDRVRLFFDEDVSLPAVFNPSQYVLDGGVTALSAAAGPAANIVDVTTTPLTYPNTYTIRVTGVSDLATVPNLIAPGSTFTFTATEYQSQDIGRPGAAGSIVRLGPSSFDVTAAGADTADSSGRFNSDQFTYSWQIRTGDFDIQTRVDSLDITDAFANAGLMARESLNGNARFAGAFASSYQLGCFFKARTTNGATTIVMAPTGGVPVNYPQTWLRLRRLSGTNFTGFASYDGQNWISLGSTNLANMPASVYFGLSALSESSNSVTQVRFRDVGPTLSTNLSTTLPPGETMGPSSRRTSLVFSEIMYHPKPQPDVAANLEFIEIYNSGPTFEELTGYHVEGGIHYDFPAGFTIQSGQFIVIAADPAALQAAYGIKGVLGPWQGTLNNAGDALQLYDAHGGLKLDMAYAADPPWPAGPDGAGPSLVISRPSYGESSPKAWSASSVNGGTPGRGESWNPVTQQGVVINELLARPGLAQTAFVELFNPTGSPIDLAGCVLTDDPTTNRFVIPAGTKIAPAGFVSFPASQLGFGPAADGGTVYFESAGAARVLDAVRFTAQETGVSIGRTPDGSGPVRRLLAPTPGASNTRFRPEAVVINEIMYRPISQDDNDEFIELYNRSSASVDLSGWKLISGVSYTFPVGTLIPADSYLVIARSRTQLLSHYPALSAALVLGDYSGRLGNKGDRIALAKPDVLVTTNSQGKVQTKNILVAQHDVTYAVGGRWGQWSSGGGSSMELIDPDADPLQPSSWADSDETQKAPWTQVSLTDVLENGNTGFSPTFIHIGMQGMGECLVDEVEVFKQGSTNLCLNGNFESTVSAQKWELKGNHSTSTIDTNGNAFSGNACLHVRSQGDADTGVNSIRRSLQAGLSTGVTATIRARIRWLAGWPQALFRVHGNYMALQAQMTVPTNLGTPGARNSRRIDNAGPAIYEVAHAPAIPRIGQQVLVTCRAMDPQGVSNLTLHYRFDPVLTYTNVVMADDGQNGDAVAGDGIYSGYLPARSNAGIVAFYIDALDGAATPAHTTFPASAPVQECLVRWGDAVPFTTYSHYHMWNTAAIEKARNSSIALDNTYRDMTLVYGNGRIIYNAGFRDKGSPYHSGAGDYAVTVPADDLLLGVDERIFGSTGNGGAEASGIRGRICAWISKEMGIPYLHAHEILVYRNGVQHQTVSEDNEQPNNYYAEGWYPTGQNGELHKIAVWFEEDGTSSATGATMEMFRKKSGQLDMNRYRWNWQIRANKDANDYTDLLNLVTALNAPGDYVPGLMAQADMEEWMKVFGYHRITGNWDSWTFNVGQNMFIYRQPAGRWVLLQWDIDFVLGLGNAKDDALGGGQDPIANSRIYANPTFRRMLWRVYQDAVNGPLQTSRYTPVIDAYWAAMQRNRIPGLSSPSDVGPYIRDRRDFIRNQLHLADAVQFAITNNNGSDFTATGPVLNLTGIAPFAVASIQVNGTPYPVRWTDTNSYAISVPLATGANRLTVVGIDNKGNPVPGASDTITVTYKGEAPSPRDFVVINEIHYNPTVPKGSFIELYNTSTNVPFDLSGFRLDGVGYEFPPGSIIAPTNYMVLAKSRVDFAPAYGVNIPVWDEFPGSLNSGGEHLRLVQPGATPAEDVLIDDVKYNNTLPWPAAADGFGPSLQLIDPLQDTYRVANWATTATNDVNNVTPGRANAVRLALPAFPKVWINEVLPNNVAGPVDNAGDHDPFIEFYNAGASVVDMSGLYLSDNYTNLTQWQFPAGSQIPAHGFLTVWADGESAESTAAAPHTSFRLAPGAGSIALSRMQGSPAAPAVLDYLNYSKLPADRSYGCVPDGEPRTRQMFYYITVGATNNPNYPDVPVRINEFMANNTSTVADPADGKFSDWFELYNSGSTPVDLTGYTLTDNLTNSTQFVIPPGYVIPAKAFLLVWADGDTQQNTSPTGDLHTNFKLTDSGEALGLFAPDGRMVDGFTFGQQYPDISGGRYPDGADGNLVYMPSPSPKAPNNILGINLPPSITAIADKSINELTTLAFKVEAKDSNPGQAISFALINNPPAGASIDTASGVFQWTPDETQGPGDYTVTVSATDNGIPPASSTIAVHIHVDEANTAPTLGSVAPQTLEAGQPYLLKIAGTDADIPAQTLTYSLGGPVPLGMGINPQSGDLTWFPTPDQVGTYPVTVVVTDDGTPALGAQILVSFEVKAPIITEGPRLDVALLGDHTITLSWLGVNGSIYHVEATDSLTHMDWKPFTQVVGADGLVTVAGIDATASTERYFRLVIPAQ